MDANVAADDPVVKNLLETSLFKLMILSGCRAVGDDTDQIPTPLQFLDDIHGIVKENHLLPEDGFPPVIEVSTQIDLPLLQDAVTYIALIDITMLIENHTVLQDHFTHQGIKIRIQIIEAAGIGFIGIDAPVAQRIVQIKQISANSHVSSPSDAFQQGRL